MIAAAQSTPAAGNWTGSNLPNRQQPGCFRAPIFGRHDTRSPPPTYVDSARRFEVARSTVRFASHPPPTHRQAVSRIAPIRIAGCHRRRTTVRRSQTKRSSARHRRSPQYGDGGSPPTGPDRSPKPPPILHPKAADESCHPRSTAISNRDHLRLANQPESVPRRDQRASAKLRP